MTPTLNVDAHYAYFHNQQAITFTARSRVSGDTDTAVASALRVAVSAAEVSASGGAYSRLDAVWHIPATLIPAVSPKPGDQITDSTGTVWVVLSATLTTFTSRWECVARNVKIYYDLRDEVSIFRPVKREEGAGRNVVDWAPVAVRVSARVQEVSLGDTLEHDRRKDVVRYDVIMGTAVAIHSDYRLIWHTPQSRPRTLLERLIQADGSVQLDIQSWSDSDRIDALMTIQCKADA